MRFAFQRLLPTRSQRWIHLGRQVPPVAILLLSLAGCSDQVDETYATYADAQRAGAVERGWIPAFVPSSARNIASSHHLDTRRQTLRFTAPPLDVGEMVMQLRSVSATDQAAAAALFAKHDFGAASEAYIVCSKPLNGALAIERRSGRAAYDTTVRWTDDDCP